MNDVSPTAVPSGLTGRIEIHPGSRPGILTVYFRQPNGVLRRLPQAEVDQILAGMEANLEKFQIMQDDQQLPG